MAYYNPLFVAGSLPSTGPVYDPNIPIFTSPPDSGGVLSGIINTVFGGGSFGGPPSVPIMGFSPVGGVGGVSTMPTPVQTAGHCLLRRHRRMNWANPRALTRANRRLHAFNKHARKFIKITRKVKTPRRRRK